VWCFFCKKRVGCCRVVVDGMHDIVTEGKLAACPRCVVVIKERIQEPIKSVQWVSRRREKTFVRF